MQTLERKLAVLPVFGEIAHPEIAALEEPLTTISRKIVEDEKSYNLIIADDISGRIPAIVLGLVLNKTNLSEDLPRIVFIRPKNNDAGLKLSQILETLDGPVSRSLLVTEHIKFGNNLVVFSKIIPSNLQFDVASVSIFTRLIRYKWLHPTGTKIYYDHIGGAPPIWFEKELSAAVFEKSSLGKVVNNDTNNLALKVLANLHHSSLLQS